METHIFFSLSSLRVVIQLNFLCWTGLGICFAGTNEIILTPALNTNAHETGRFSVKKAKPGPWGDLEYFPLVLEPPDDFIAQSIDLKQAPQKTIWLFKGDRQDVRQIFVNAGIDDAIIGELFDAPEPLVEENGTVRIIPPDRVIENLTPVQRSKLYPFIGDAVSSNPYYAPYSLHPGGIYHMTRSPSGLRPELIHLISRLTYTQATALQFSDIAYVFSKTQDAHERWRVAKTLQREFSLSVRLHVSPTSDLVALSDYWGAGGRNSMVLPLLKSISKTPGGESLDIVHLLPPTARKLLNTYPQPSQSYDRSDMPDCFSTSFSFFADEPPGRFLDYVGPVLNERYEKARQPWQLGDVILCFEPETGKWVHACNYVADGIVFSKNGKSRGRPWILGELNEIIAAYLKKKEMTASFYRLKPEFRR